MPRCLASLYYLLNRRKKICMNWCLVQIKDVDAGKFILLLDLIYFGMIALCAMDAGPSKNVYLIME
jgi:hypothetical protein